MGEERVAEIQAGRPACPGTRLADPGAAGEDSCPALLPVEAEPGSEEYLGEAVSALLGCRAFLWDVLLDGDWTGCARKRLRELSEGYGWERVCQAMEEDEG